jgi:hypothetical protein
MQDNILDNTLNNNVDDDLTNQVAKRKSSDKMDTSLSSPLSGDIGHDLSATSSNAANFGHAKEPVSSTASSPLWLKNFVKVYQELCIDNLNLLETIYHKDVVFVDPIHKVEGFDNLYHYFEGLYQNLACCDFVIEQVIVQNSQAAIYWKMTYQHTKLNKGKAVTIVGNSHIKGEGNKVIYHRDYLDLGAMLYEQLPILGKFIVWIKKQAAK